MAMMYMFTHQQWKSSHREKKTEAHVKLDLKRDTNRMTGTGSWIKARSTKDDNINYITDIYHRPHQRPLIFGLLSVRAVTSSAALNAQGF